VIWLIVSAAFLLGWLLPSPSRHWFQPVAMGSQWRLRGRQGVWVVTGTKFTMHPLRNWDYIVTNGPETLGRVSPAWIRRNGTLLTGHEANTYREAIA